MRRDSLALALLPDALGLQAVGHFLRHVGLVVLGQHAVGDEHAVRPEAAFGDDALLLAEQVRQDAAYRRPSPISPCRSPRRRPRCPAPRTIVPFSTRPPSRMRWPGGTVAAGEVGGHVEIGGLLAERIEGQRRGQRRGSPGRRAITDSRFCLRVIGYSARCQAERRRQRRRASCPPRCRRRAPPCRAPARRARIVGLCQAHDRNERAASSLPGRRGFWRSFSSSSATIVSIIACAVLRPTWPPPPRSRPVLRAASAAALPARRAWPRVLRPAPARPRRARASPAGSVPQHRLPGRRRFGELAFLRQRASPGRSSPSAWPARASAPRSKASCASAETMPPAAPAIASPSPALARRRSRRRAGSRCW